MIQTAYTLEAAKDARLWKDSMSVLRELEQLKSFLSGAESRRLTREQSGVTAANVNVAIS